jgi:hypothetical protein
MEKRAVVDTLKEKQAHKKAEKKASQLKEQEDKNFSKKENLEKYSKRSGGGKNGPQK